MSFFDDFMGTSAPNDAAVATGDANSILRGAQRNARGQLNRGFQQQRQDLASGYAGATGAINTGANTARGDLTTGATGAEGAINDSQSYINQILQPYINSGSGAQARYDTALGANGSAAAGQFYQDYGASDPFRQYNEDKANEGILRAANAGGSANSGRTSLAIGRASLERGSTDLNRYLDRLAAQGAQGGQYASQAAGFRSQNGRDIANIRTGLGTALGNVETNRGTQLGNMSYGYGQDRGTIAQNQGQDNANLTYGTGQQIAGNRIGLGNAYAQNRGVGVNNLLSLGGAVIAAATPGAAGVSALGNIAGKFK